MYFKLSNAQTEYSAELGRVYLCISASAAVFCIQTHILMEDLSPSCYSLLDLDPELLWITVSFIEDKAALQRSCRCLRQGARMEGNTMQEHRGEASYHFAFADDLPVYI